MKTIALLGMFLIICGCSAFQPDKQALKLNCEYPDTIVLLNGKKEPCQSNVEVLRNGPLQIEASRPGYKTHHRIIGRHFSKTAIWDMVGTCAWFFPVFGLLTPGAWDFDETTINISLLPES